MALQRSKIDAIGLAGITFIVGVALGSYQATSFEMQQLEVFRDNAEANAQITEVTVEQYEILEDEFAKLYSIYKHNLDACKILKEDYNTLRGSI